MKHIFKSLLFVVFLFLGVSVQAQPQKAPFYKEIAQYKKQDSLQFPQKNAVLFVGSSSLRLWKDLENVFKAHGAINRGFGGSTLADAIYYADAIIYPYQPKHIFIYSGENDIASGASVDVTVDRFKILFNLIRKQIPKARISYISIKPSISREKFDAAFQDANAKIKSFLSSKPATDFIDVYQAMLAENGKVRQDIFIQDNLHMNQKGYDIWIKALKPYF
ncbi:GDSL-type esterase/lipase family protein [Pedobacter glucosidilyticus]|uniref:GDSL-type esterase/lipase family protein n=1 Tax=Pedobacter glucosidilyticus TaxID=1122941 RepID=UPI0026EFA5E1|nr:GDSL-type esterase/lipase family protein [Pedobacter glucosidilyticus]